MSNERWLFILPNNDFEVLVGTVCVLQNYIAERAVKGSTVGEIVFQATGDLAEWLEYFRCALPPMRVVTMLSGFTRNDFDLVVILDGHELREIGRTTGKSLVVTIGLMIGSGVRVPFPNLSHVCKGWYEKKADILFIPWRWASQCGTPARVDIELFRRDMEIHYPDKTFSVLVIDDCIEMMKLVASHDTIIGGASIATFIGASLGKHVLAVTTEEQPAWYSITRSLRTKTLIVNDLFCISPSVAVDMLEMLWQDQLEESIPTAQSQLGAHRAVDPSEIPFTAVSARRSV